MIRIYKLQILIALFLIGACSTKSKPHENNTMEQNPFFSKWGTPFEVPAFDKITIAHFKPAFIQGIAEQAKAIETILNETAAPTFTNTIEALELSDTLLTQVSTVFYNQLSSNTNDSLQALAKEIEPLVSAHHDNISLNAALFERVKAVYANADKSKLSIEEARLLDETYKEFVRNGANLNDTEKASMRKLNEQLSVLSLQFGDNQLAEDNAWTLVLENESDLDGLPQSLVDAAAEAATEANQKGKWLISMHKPSWIPFLQYATRRDLREQVYNAWMQRCSRGDKFDNQAIIAKIAELRLQKANLLGFKSWAAYVLDDNMAKNEANVYALLDNVWSKALAMAKKEAEAMQAMILAEGGDFKLESWDWWYYAEKIRKEKYQFDEEMLRPYFELENVKTGVFHVANKLWGIHVTQRNDLPKPHPDAQAFEVTEADGTHIGILYMDFFPRASKHGGAWMDAFREQHYNNGTKISPVITNVFNFSKPVGDTPALLTFDEVRTVFHEFGHGLHGLLSNCKYRSLAGTSVANDFVELPSQVLENWAGEPEVLKVYAKHYKTGEIIPNELVAKMEAASKFNQGFATVEYVAAAYLDLDWHSITEPLQLNAEQLEANSMSKIGLISEIIPRYRSAYFSHVFSGGYSAGYYSYLWAEVLDADAFMAFKEAGNIFDPERARLFRAEILSKGGTEDPMVLYKRFRGREPHTDALLAKRGLQ